jgi:hypothetical protein
MTQHTQDSYPRWKVTLIARVEEFNQEGEPTKFARQQAILQDLKAGQPNAPLEAVLDPAAQALGIRRWVVSSKGSSSVGAGGPLEKRPIDNFDFQIPGIIPWDVQFSRNGFHQADTLSFKVRLADFPFDPRLMRAVGVKFYLGTLPAEKAATGLETLDVLIPDSWVDLNGRNRSNLRFKGWVDQMTSDWPDDEEPYVEFQCRDNTCLLLDQEFPPAYTSPDLNTHPIDQAVAILLSNFPQMEGLAVEYRPVGDTPPSLNGALQGTFARPQLGPVSHLAGGAGVGGGAGGAKLSVWDYITDITGAIGHMARLEGDTIVIQSVRTATSHNFPKRVDDFYTSQTPPETQGLTLSRRTLVYGRDLQELKIVRNYTKNAANNIEVRCYNPTGVEKVLVARFPPPGVNAVVGPNAIIQTGLGAKPIAKWTVIRVSGIATKEQLVALAQAYYENQGRQEIIITASTQDLASFGGDGADPDLLDLQAGDAVSILFRGSDRDNFQTYADIETTMNNTAKAVSFLSKLGFDSKFAQLYSQQFQKAGKITTFRVKTVGITCNETEGVSIEMELMNYIEIRADKVSLETPQDDPSYGK